MGFRFKRFTIDDSKCAMKVGTDGVLLGTWAHLDGGIRKILDVGAGSGLVSLILAQRTQSLSDILIHAVEIDYGAYNDCLTNFKNSYWAERLIAYNDSFLNINEKYDLIISNPPFFIESLKSSDIKRSLARQGDSLNYFSLIDYAVEHLTETGKLVFVSDIRFEKEILYYSELRGLKLSRICHIRDSEIRPVKRILWELSHDEPTEICKFVLSLKEQNGDFTKQYKKLTEDFYLNI